MRISQLLFSNIAGWSTLENNPELPQAQLVLVFGSREHLTETIWFASLRKQYLKAEIISLSTSGNIQDSEVTDNTLTATVVEFAKTRIKTTLANIGTMENSYEAGKIVGSILQESDLKHLLIFSEGNKVNGSELVKGLNEVVKAPITGGLAGDAARFEKTLVGLNNLPSEGNIVGLALYGTAIEVGYGHFGGWDPFGPDRLVTKSKNNILFELDGKSALELYKTYLGDKAKDLPGSALLFPLGMRLKENGPMLTRTILSINEADQSMVFAGDVPEGATVQLMKANFEKLIDASSTAAEKSLLTIGPGAELALLISCVGRKLVLDQRIEEEVDAVRDILGPKPKIAGFYSYGEISSILDSPSCELHNQTMTITLLKENL